MKKVIGVILIILVMAGIGFFLYMEFNKEELVYSGDYPVSTDAYSTSVTRAYVSDASDRSQIAAILETVFTSTDLTAEEVAGAATGYGTVLYAPVFTVMLDEPKADERYFTLTGNVLNGISENGETAVTEYLYSGMRLDAIMQNATIKYASNAVKPTELVKREYTLPVIAEEAKNAAFMFDDSNGFQFVFSIDDAAAETRITLLFSYNVKAANPVNFSSLENEYFQLVITFNYDENGVLVPTYTVTKLSEIAVETADGESTDKS